MNQNEPRSNRRRSRNIAISIMIALIVVLGITAVILVSNQGSHENRSTPNQQGEEADSSNNTKDSNAEEIQKDNAKQEENEEDTQEEVLESDEQSGNMLTLSEQQMHTGNLILVNGDYAYDFELNTDVELVEIEAAQTFEYHANREGMQLAKMIMTPLEQMIRDCNIAMGSESTGIASGYRTREYQQGVYDEYASEYGIEYANTYVATPGYSEHHTGLALDMGIYYADGIEGSFSASENAVWMDENSYKYGFVRRYREDKRDITKINNEAWHFRYVGIPHATYMKEQNLCLEEYMDYLRDHTSQDTPLEIDFEQGKAAVYFTKKTQIVEPEGEYSVSGNNVDGYIITYQV